MQNGTGQPTPFAGDITASPKKREKSEPPSLHACARAVFFGPAHTHAEQEQPVKTMAAASLMMSPDETYHFHEDTVRRSGGGRWPHHVISACCHHTGTATWLPSFLLVHPRPHLPLPAQAAHKFSYPLPKLIVLGILAGAPARSQHLVGREGGLERSLCCPPASGRRRQLQQVAAVGEPSQIQYGHRSLWQGSVHSCASPSAF